jgi:hypothetical protein
VINYVLYSLGNSVTLSLSFKQELLEEGLLVEDGLEPLDCGIELSLKNSDNVVWGLLVKVEVEPSSQQQMEARRRSIGC